MARDDNGTLIEIEVVFALREKQTLLRLSVSAGTTVREAIAQSGIAAMHDGNDSIDADHGQFGIFGKRVTADAVLENGDRIEIYRPLTADPKEARRRRARKRRLS